MPAFRLFGERQRQTARGLTENWLGASNQIAEALTVANEKGTLGSSEGCPYSRVLSRAEMASWLDP